MKAILLFLVFSLAACSLPKSEVSLMDVDRKEIYCNSDDVGTTYEKISPRLKRCFNVSRDVRLSGGGRIQSGEVLFEKQDEDGNTVFIIAATSPGSPLYYGLRLKLESNDDLSCPTKMTFHTMNFAWGRYVTRIKKWLVDPESGCSI